MFLDERIAIQSGKIFKKVNILVIIISLLFLISRSIIYIFSKQNISFGLFSTEICTLLCASIILIYGEIKYITNEVDERSIFNKYEYYARKGKILLIWILVGYAISMIDSFKRIASDFPPNQIIFIFQVVGVIYLYYQFKKNQININYTFINNDKKTYYKQVFIKIGYLILIIIGIYFTCGIISIIIYNNLEYILIFLIAAIHSILGLGLQYLLLSHLEKIDYDNEKDIVKKPFLISGIIVTTILFIQTILVFLSLYIAENGLVSKMGEFLSSITNTRNNLGFIASIYGGIALCYLLSYCLKNKMIKRSISIYLLLMVITTITGIISNIPAIILDHSFELIQSYYQSITYVNTFFSITYIIIFGFIIYSLIKEKGINNNMILIPILELLFFFLCIFLSTQGSIGRIISSTLNSFIDFLAWLLFYLLVYKMKNKKEIEES